jgi:poly(A) polymerase
MVEPRVVPRAEHTLSRRDIDPDALKVLYRLRQFEHIAYLVGGSVRDLLIGRRPKDFDIGTSAHPYQVKKLFRNCWIIGRRFRLAHVRFGQKVIEVATFRRQVAPGEEVVEDGVPAPRHHLPPEADRDPADLQAADPESANPDTGGGANVEDGAAPELHTDAHADHLIHHDNTFGTPEQDAFRRDFTINALFYDIATFSIIDYVDGLSDLKAGIVRSIGDPEVRFREDPVRMMRAVALAARLDFQIDSHSLEAMRVHRHEIARSSPPRLLEEYYKILRAGASERTFRDLARLGLLEPISKELHHGAAESLWQSLAALDAHRQQFDSVPETMTNAILLGSLIVPLGLMRDRAHDANMDHANREGVRRRLASPQLGQLPLARRDIERLRQLLAVQRRLREIFASPRSQRALTHRSIFREALAWLEIHGRSPEIVEHWHTRLGVAETAPADDETAPVELGRRRRRRRRRRRSRPIAEH